MTQPDWSLLHPILQQHNSFLITSHVRPDADALGSELGLRFILQSLGKTVSIWNGSAPPANLEFMDPDNTIRQYAGSASKADVPVVEVILVVDTSAWQQLGGMSDVIRASAARRVVIDHHVSADRLDAVEFRDTQAAATGELIHELAESLGLRFDTTTANVLYAAIATDTGWFRFPSTTARTMRIAASLLDQGASPHSVYRLIHEQNSLARLRLAGRVLSRAVADADGRLIWIQAEKSELDETGAVAADTEGLVNECLTVAGAEAAFIAVELPGGAVKFSLRCRSPHNVAAVAELFAGGGHTLASGCRLTGPMKTAVGRVREAMLAMLIPSAPQSA
ncbi:MAG: DHH family phosphoesterase [Planctomycetota bacterium]